MGNDFFTALVSSTLATIEVFIGLTAIQVERVGFSTLSWLGFAFLLLFQPLLQKTTYPDALVFPISLLIIATAISLCAINLKNNFDKHLIVCYIAWTILVVGVLSAGTQIFQLFVPEGNDFIMPISDRLYVNLAQPNLAAFVNVLAITAIFYLVFSYQKNKKLIFFLAFLFVILTVGISLSLSRSGIILLVISIFSALFYSWSKKHRFFISFMAIFLSVVGYNFGLFLMKNFLPNYTLSGVDRLLSYGVSLRQVLLERTWSDFMSNPIFGVGYDNYYSYGLHRIDQWRWFESADHAHNLVAQILAEFGLVGFFTSVGVIWVLLTKFRDFLKNKISNDDLFVCFILAVFLLYSFSEFPLWYPKFLLVFSFLVGILDKGFLLKMVRLDSYH